MRTAIIKQRVADFLKQHAPFDCLPMEDLLVLAGTGRVSFHQANETVCRAGDPRKPYIYVVQQGRVDLLGDNGESLRDILTAGDTIGLECLLPGQVYLDTARTAGDVILYGLDPEIFVEISDRHPEVGKYLAAHFTARRANHDGPTEPSPALSWASHVPAPGSAAEEEALTVQVADSIGDVVSALAQTGRTIALLAEDSAKPSRVVSLATAAVALARGGTAADASVPLVTASENTTAGDLFLTLIRSQAPAVLLQRAGGDAIVTAESLANITGWNPPAAIAAIRRTDSPNRLNALRAATDQIALSALTGPDAVEWAGRFTAERNRALLAQLAEFQGRTIFCFGEDARGERIGSANPILSPIGETIDCGAVLSTVGFAGPQAECACPRTLEDWAAFYRDLLTDPIGNDVYAARRYLDLELALGDRAHLDQLRASIGGLLREHSSFVVIVANDALGKLPPLTFYKDVVVDIEGGSSPVLDLEKVAVTPIVDAARAFALAAGDLEHVGTIARLRSFGEFLPAAKPVCRRAADAFRIVAYRSRSQAGRDPTPPDKYERELLKSAFRSIADLLQLLEAYFGFGHAH